MAEYIEYHPLKFWLDPASIAEIVAHIQTYLVNNPINSTTEIETIIHDYLIAHPELIGGVDSVNGLTGEVVLTADNISAGENVTIKDVLDSLQDQIDDIIASIPSDYQQLIDDVSDLKSAVRDITGNERIAYTVDNAYYNTSTVGSTVINPTESNKFQAAMIPCSPGDRFTISGTGGVNGRLWAFLDAEHKVTRRETRTTAINKEVITAGTGEVYLVINNHKVNNPGAVSYYGELLLSAFSELSADIPTITGYFKSFDISLGSNSGIGNYWNTYIPMAISAGDTVEVKMRGYSGDNFRKCIVYGVTAGNAQVTIIDEIGIGRSCIAKAGQDFVTLWIQIARTSAEDNVTAAFDVITDAEKGLAGFVIDNKQHIFTVKKDGTGDFTSLVKAVNTATKFMDSVVYVGPGEWDIIEEFGEAYMQSVSSIQRGLYLKNRVHLIFSSNAVVKALYSGFNGVINDNTVRWFSVFNSGEYGFTLENCHIVSRNIRYAVHDERSQTSDEAYCNKYINCSMSHSNQKYDNSQSVSGFGQCIGGGLGTDGYIVIDGCVFENPYQYSADAQGRKVLVSYHVNNKTGATGKSMIDVHGCYFKDSGTIRAGYLGANTDVSTMLVHDNSMGKEPFVIAETQSATVENIEMLAWNNEIRTS